MRRHRPIMNAMKNPCIGNPSVQQISGPPAPAREAVWHPYSPYWQAQAQFGTSLQSNWIPATSGPQPPNTAQWVVWTGGSTGTRYVMGSNVGTPVKIVSSMQGGPSGVLVQISSMLATNPREHNQRHSMGGGSSGGLRVRGESTKQVLSQIGRALNPIAHVRRLLGHEATHERLQH